MYAFRRSLSHTHSLLVSIYVSIDVYLSISFARTSDGYNNKLLQLLSVRHRCISNTVRVLLAHSRSKHPFTSMHLSLRSRATKATNTINAYVALLSFSTRICFYRAFYTHVDVARTTFRFVVGWLMLLYVCAVAFARDSNTRCLCVCECVFVWLCVCYVCRLCQF